MKFKSKIYLDYDDVDSMNTNLVHDVSKFKPDIIVGITRGGLLPALHLSHHLDRPMKTIQWQTRDADKCEHNEEIQNYMDHDARVIFVDDINDTGRTFLEISKRYHGSRPNIRFTSLVKKQETNFPYASAALTLIDKRWIVFPWEKD
jgi:hypoxanthine phosphoribosyltransferase